MTPLELAALLSAIANNGTLYHLQYPRTQSEIEWFVPKVKRQLELAPNSIADIKFGMRGAVDYGTAQAGQLRSQRADFRQDRNLHRFPGGRSHGLVRVVQRGRATINWWSW